ncbi:MAG: LamB/YcsF family protein [Candidatus Binatia bacterium]
MSVINCDMGGGFGSYRMGGDEGILAHATVATVACGVHASVPSIMRRTARLAKRHSIRVGPHLSLPERQGFSRREMKIEPGELGELLLDQVGSLPGATAVAPAVREAVGAFR